MSVPSNVLYIAITIAIVTGLFAATNVVPSSSGDTAAIDRLTAEAQIERTFTLESNAIQASDECEPDWVSTFGGMPGLNGTVHAMAIFDDGSGDGPALYVGGEFVYAGGLPARRIAKWDGESWSALGSGFNHNVRSLAVFDDGSGNGPALYAGGHFTIAGGVSANRVAKWDGESWSAVGTGTNGTVFALTSFDDGSGGGPSLYAGGEFLSAGGTNAPRVAKWDGESWSALGDGMNQTVQALTVFDDGSGDGPALYAGGDFTTAGGETANRIARWDGQAWSPLSSGMTGHSSTAVYALTVFDDGSGSALYAGGSFSTAGGISVGHIARWDGDSWSALGTGTNGFIHALTVFDDGSGPALYAGGTFTDAGGRAASCIARWYGREWSPLGGGVNEAVYALMGLDEGVAPALYAGGEFDTAEGLTALRLARWDGELWSSPFKVGLDMWVYSVAVYDGLSDGPALFVGGDFGSVGGISTHRIAKWDGSEWAPLGSGTSSKPRAMIGFDDGSGPALFAAGSFSTAGGISVNRIAKWNGLEWSPLGSGVDSVVWALEVFDDGSGPALYAGGSFSLAGGVGVSRIARWDGNEWVALGNGLSDGEVRALKVFDDGLGGGPALYAGGSFTSTGGESANYVAKWNGSEWSALSFEVNNPVAALEVFDDGSGPALYAGGGFTVAGNVFAYRIAKWDGREWSPLSSGIHGGSNPYVVALAVMDDGTGGGPALYAAGPFTAAGAVIADGIAKWDGHEWSPLVNGLGNPSGYVNSLAVSHDGLSSTLYAGGLFSTSPAGDSYLAKWQGCPLEPECRQADLNCDGVVDVSDLLILLAAWGDCPHHETCPADLTGDGVVDVSDLLILLANWK